MNEGGIVAYGQNPRGTLVYIYILEDMSDEFVDNLLKEISHFIDLPIRLERRGPFISH